MEHDLFLRATVVRDRTVQPAPPASDRLLPFRIGVNIPSQMEGYGNDTQTTLIYKDRTTGQQREFDLADTTWYDTLRWEYVDTRIVENNRKRRSEIRTFPFSTPTRIMRRRCWLRPAKFS